MLWTTLSIFALAAMAPMIVRLLGERAGWLLAIGPAAVLIYWAYQWPQVAGDGLTQTFTWVPAFGVDLVLRGDGLTGSMAMLISGIGALIVLYAGAYLHGDKRLGRFYSYLFLFMGAMLGLVISDNLITLFVFWELTSVSSYLLIGFNHDKTENRDAALKALLVTAGGGLALLAGVVMLAGIGHSLGLSPSEALRISALTPYAADIQQHPLFPAMLVLVLLGCFTKSAQVPFHFWLPAAMAGPTPVSAFLHSATMVKAGVFLLARLHPMLGGSTLWVVLVTTVGAATMLLGAVMAVGQRDLKAILAYTTISVLGTLVMLLGIGTDGAIQAAVVFLFAHGLYKAALFMVAGNVDHATGTRDVTRLSGLRHAMALSATAGLLAALSKAGAPPMFGYLGKKMMLEVKLDIEAIGLWLMVLAVAANICMVAVALLITLKPFWGTRQATPHEPHEAPWAMSLSPLLLAVLGLFVGLVPGVFDSTIGTAMASAIRGEPLEMKLKLLFGLNPESLIVVGISFGALLIGYLLYRWLKPGRSFRGPFPALARLGPERGYRLLLAGTLSLAAAHTRFVQPGYLRRYLLVMTGAFALVVGPLAWRALDIEAAGITLPTPMVHEVTLALVMIVCAFYAVLTGSRLAAVASIGGTGIAIAVLFAVFGAIDVAITQLMVETLMIILLVMVLRRMPRVQRRSSTLSRARDALVALAAGATVSLLVLASASVALPANVSTFFLDRAAPEGFGRNVVNVILVDFRALDTLGEIVVVAVAAIGVGALLWAGRARRGLRPRHGVMEADR